MKRKSANTEKLPKDTPKGTPKGKPKGKPKAAPEIVPIKRSVRRPIVTSTVTPEANPENTVYWLYEAPHFNQRNHPGYKKTHNRYWGRRIPEEFFTDQDAEDYIDEKLHGDFIIAERTNGHVGVAWHHASRPLDETGEELVSDDLAFVDLDDVNPDTVEIFRNPLVRAEVEKARLKAENAALRNAPAHNGYDPITKTVLEQALPQILKPKRAVEEIREAKELLAELTPRREVTAPSPAPSPVDPKIEALKLIAESPNTAEIVKEVFFGSKSESERDPWAEVAMEAVKSGQLGPIVQAAINGLGNLFANFLPKPAQAPAPAQTQQPQQQVTPAETQQQALPDAQQQQPQATQPQSEQPPQMTAADQLIFGLIELMRRNASMAETRQLINLWEYRAPELSENIDMLVEWPIDQTLSVLSAYHPEVSTIPHAREWLQSLINSLTAEETGEFKETEL